MIIHYLISQYRSYRPVLVASKLRNNICKPSRPVYISQNKIIAETYNDYQIFVFEVYTHCPLTLTCENDILFLLYYVLHFYKCNKPNNFQYYMTNGRGTSIVYGGHIGIAKKIAYRSKNCGGGGRMTWYLLLS